MASVDDPSVSSLNPFSTRAACGRSPGDHGILEQLGQLLLGRWPRRELGDSLLGQGPSDQGGNVRLAVADSLESVRDIQALLYARPSAEVMVSSIDQKRIFSVVSCEVLAPILGYRFGPSSYSAFVSHPS